MTREDWLKLREERPDLGLRAVDEIKDPDKFFESVSFWTREGFIGWCFESRMLGKSSEERTLEFHNPFVAR